MQKRPQKHSPEGEYFVLEDVENKRRLSRDVHKAMDAQQKQALKALHFMHCPKCGMEMHEMWLQGLRVDACFVCGGAFLGKAEIDVIAAPQQKGIMAAILNWFKDEAAS